MPYIPHTKKDIREMLKSIGAQNVDELFAGIPAELKLEAPLNLPDSLSEMELVSALKRLQKRNMDVDELSMFIGAGAYRHFTPSIVNHLISRSEFSTAYTPYQPEVSQGTLQAIFEFQSMVCMLTAMETANASMYDGASSLAEAVLMANRVNGREEILMPRSVHPEYRQVVNTYLRGNGMSIVDIPFKTNGQTDIDFIVDKVGDKTCAVILQSPNFFGVVEEYDGLSERLQKSGALLVVSVVEALSLGILKPPGERGADIVTGEGQSFGLPISYGGPYVGFFATREKFRRQMPGRLAGETVDREGKRAYALTLATREQHIRREKATSNICTNQGLCALAATIYLAAMGKEGLRDLAIRNLQKADTLKNKLSKLEQFAIKFDGDSFNEFVLECPEPAESVREKLLQERIVAGEPLGRHYPEMKNSLLLCATEMNTVEEMDRLAEKLGEI